MTNHSIEGAFDEANQPYLEAIAAPKGSMLRGTAAGLLPGLAARAAIVFAWCVWLGRAFCVVRVPGARLPSARGAA
mgnify:CR=1 FL=1